MVALCEGYGISRRAGYKWSGSLSLPQLGN